MKKAGRLPIKDTTGLIKVKDEPREEEVEVELIRTEADDDDQQEEEDDEDDSTIKSGDERNDEMIASNRKQETPNSEDQQLVQQEGESLVRTLFLSRPLLPH